MAQGLNSAPVFPGFAGAVRSGRAHFCKPSNLAKIETLTLDCGEICMKLGRRITKTKMTRAGAPSDVSCLFPKKSFSEVFHASV
jgi:hypothetical protein